MMTDQAHAFDFMVLISYAVRADAAARGYDDWLRRVDNPFFNAAPQIAHYANWEVTGGANPFAPNTHFDFVGMKSLDDLDAVWNDPQLNAFRLEWRKLWGLAEANPAARIETCLCQRGARAPMRWTDRLALLPDAGEAPAGWETWRVLRSLRGTGIGFERFHLRFFAGHEGVASGAVPPGAALASCIAAPQMPSSSAGQPGGE
jgi:hypothetical protein